MSNIRLRIALTCALLLVPVVAEAQDAAPFPRISEEAFKARLPFFDYDPGIPLEARVVRQWDNDDTLRQKIVFRGAQGFLVPGYLEWPKEAPKPYPLVVLLHGWSGGKDNWYEDDNYVYGGVMRKALLDAGYGVLALDAATHGERSNEIDYLDVNAFDDPKAPPRRDYFTFWEITLQTVKDYRRALDYMAERGEIDMHRVGLLGYSMGGMDAICLLAVEPRIKMAVVCVPPLVGASYGPTAPMDYTWGIGQKPFLMIMGRQDEMCEPPKVEASRREYFGQPNTKLTWFDSGHKLPVAYVADALAWVKQYL